MCDSKVFAIPVEYRYTVSVFGTSGCMHSAIACTVVFSEEREQLDVVKSPCRCDLEVVVPYSSVILIFRTIRT